MEIICPKCQTSQPETDTCVKCQVVISKYLKAVEQQQIRAAQRPVFPGQPKKSGKSGLFDLSGLSTAVILAVVVVISLFGAFKWYNANYAVKGKYDATSSRYVNSYHGFSVEIPNGWKKFTVEETPGCRTEKAYFPENFYYITGPDTPTGSVLIIKKVLSAENASEFDWDGFTTEIKNYFKFVKLNEVVHANGFKIYRIGYLVQGGYIEQHIFQGDSGDVLDIHIKVVDHENSHADLNQMKEIIASLKGEPTGRKKKAFVRL